MDCHCRGVNLGVLGRGLRPGNFTLFPKCLTWFTWKLGNRRFFGSMLKVGEGTGVEKFAVNMLVLGFPM